MIDGEIVLLFTAESMAKLTHLILEDNYFGNLSISKFVEIAEAKTCPLKELSIIQCEMSEETILKLIRVLPLLSHLEVLDLSGKIPSTCCANCHRKH
jgi:hypothetical protein